VIIPEVQARLDRSDPELRPTFILSSEEGLDIQLPADVPTASPRFEAALQGTRGERLDEEMRLFYVAVTRAEHSVVLVGSGSMQPKPPESAYYSWKDEVLRARPALQRAGARFGGSSG
jgi:DNA helicase-2/ATP-dependent DNA helicase PcrA